MSNQTALVSLTNKLAARFDMGDNGAELVATLKATAFKGNVNDAQLMALLVVSSQYGLNPWTKEIYAFPDKNNGIVPVVGVDGWARIINSNDKFDGMEFEQDEDSCTCSIYRKDRSRPIRVTEYMAECRRGTGPWQSHPKRMLRHKAMIQCARIAFGFCGIYDQDEAERILEKDMGAAEVVSSRPAQPAALPPYQDSDLSTNIGAWSAAMQAGRTTADRVIATVSTKYTLTEAQKQKIRAAESKGGDVIDAEATEAGDDWTNDYENAETAQ